MKKNYLFLTFLFLSTFFTAYSNTDVDSLFKLIINANDSSKAEILNEISWELRNSEPEKAIDYGLEAIKFAERFNDYENLVQAHSYIGVAYRILGNYSESTDYYYKGLQLAKKYGEKEQEGYAYINIGNLHMYQGYYFNALENLNHARIIAEELQHKRMLAYVHLNIGRAQMLRDENIDALENFNRALQLRIEINQVSGQAVCYKYIGDIYFELDDNTLALENYRKSLKVVDKDSDRDLYASIYSNISKLYLEIGDYGMAEMNVLKSLRVAQDIGSKLIIRDNYKILSEIKLRTKNYESASKYLDYIINYNDTLFNKQLSEKLFNLEYQFEKQRKQAEIDLLNKDKRIQELELNRARIYIIALLVILVLIIAMFIFVLITLKNGKEKNIILEQQKTELDNINKTKDKMFLIIGHDLRGPVGNFKSLIELILEDEEIANNKNLVDTFNVFLKSVQSISDLLENLLLWAKSQRGEVSFLPENISVNNIINKNLQLFRTIADHKGIKFNVNMEGNFDVYADKNMLLTVIRNLISNAIKFTPKGGAININVERDIQFHKISIKDTGIGFDDKTAEKIFDESGFYTTSGTNNETGSGLGLLLTKEFVEKNGGAIWAESLPGKGANFNFTIPVASFN